MEIKLIFLILLSTLSINSITAQKSDKKITLTGTVLNADKEPIVNAIVMIDDQKTNSVTDSKGNYKIKVKATASKIGIFTFGHGTKEEVINGRTQINFNLGIRALPQPRDSTISKEKKEINIVYGIIKKKTLTPDVKKMEE